MESTYRIVCLMNETQTIFFLLKFSLRYKNKFSGSKQINETEDLVKHNQYRRTL